MNIINVLEIINGIPSQIRSFHFDEENLRNETVYLAEELFKDMCKYHEENISEEDLEACLDNGEFDDGNGYEVYLIWSE